MHEFEIVSGSVEDFGDRKLYNPDTGELTLPVLIGKSVFLVKIKLI
jgi:hypothetical protein